MQLRTILILLLGLITGCATSPPPPASPDESTRRPVNSAAALELQTCQSKLTNTRLQLDEASRTAERSSCEIAQPTAHGTPATASDGAKVQSAPANTIYVVFFQYARHEVRLSEDAVDRLVADAKAATSIQVRGRTDANHDNSFDTRLAARRANAVLTLLVDHGVDPTKIRVTHQGQGDLIAPNTDETRALNRRAEIEMYRAPAQVVVLGTLATM
jgi:outer membrane protein OmpA-like peptidoglycan-associated protein